jgi:MoaA/NifB/PqqE/SkfB family radical SAM enzyme
MSVEKFTTIAKKLGGSISGLGLHWRGEPCLHPQLPKLARIAKNFGLKPWLSTNTAVPNLGKPEYVKALLDNLEWVEFCVDGYDEDTISQYRRGAKWSVVERNLSVIGEVETDCVKKMRVLRFKYNDGKESIYRDMASIYHMDEVVFAAPLIGLGETISAETAKQWLSTTGKYQRYTRRGNKWVRRTGNCYANPIISVHGTVHPCCLDWGLQHSLGDAATEPWRDIVKRYGKMRPRLGSQPMCALCCSPAQKVNFGEKIIRKEVS